MKWSYVAYGLVAISLLSILYFVFRRDIGAHTSSVLSSDIATSTAGTLSEDDMRTFLQNKYTTAVVAVGDPAFTRFVLFTLEDECPYYEPNGAVYITCLNTLLSPLKEATSVAHEQAVNKYCDRISKLYEDDLGNLELSLYLSCVVYKISK